MGWTPTSYLSTTCACKRLLPTVRVLVVVLVIIAGVNGSDSDVVFLDYMRMREPVSNGVVPVVLRFVGVVSVLVLVPILVLNFSIMVVGVVLELLFVLTLTLDQCHNASLIGYNLRQTIQ